MSAMSDAERAGWKQGNDAMRATIARQEKLIAELETALRKIVELSDLSDYEDQCSAAYSLLGQCETIARTALGE